MAGRSRPPAQSRCTGPSACHFSQDWVRCATVFVLAYCAQCGEASLTSVSFLLLTIIKELQCRIATDLQDIAK